MSKKTKIDAEKGLVQVSTYNKNVKGVGKAQCNFEKKDVFDEGVGVEIASAKSQLAYQREQLRHYKKKANDFKKKAHGLEQQAKFFFALAKEKEKELIISQGKVEDLMTKYNS